MLSLPMKLAALSAVAIIVIGAAYAASLSLNSSTSDNPEVTPTPSPSPTMNPTSSATSTPKPTNTSAIITFTVKPTMVSHVYIDNNTRGELETTRYDLNIQITWDANQAPYVRYYEITPHYNGNPQPNQNLFSTGDFRTWNSTGYMAHFPLIENEIYFLGSGALTYPNPRNFLGPFDNNINWKRDGINGVVIAVITTEYEWKFADWNATPAQLEATEKAINDFAQSYFEGWTFTVKPVS
jgi:hypothetical protein